MAKKAPPEHGPNRVREWRKKRHMTLKQAAPLIGLAWSHLARIETGERELNTIWMQLIANVFECSPADLLPLAMGSLTPEERDMIALIRRLPEPNRRMVESAVESQRPFALGDQGGEVVEFPSKAG